MKKWLCIRIVKVLFHDVHCKTYLRDLIDYLEWTDQDRWYREWGGQGISREISRGMGKTVSDNRSLGQIV